MNISESRVKQVTQTVDSFLSEFEKPLDTQERQSHFLQTYDADIVWVDHGFQVRREGQTAILGLQKAFLHANQPFHADIKHLDITSTGAVVQTIWRGRLSNDIIRPNGDVAIKASGRTFDAHVLFRLEISDEGKLTRIDEYYNKAWDLGIEEDKYPVIKGASMKE